MRRQKTAERLAGAGRRGFVVGWMGIALVFTPHVAAADPPAGHLQFFHENRDFILRAFERLPHDTAGPDSTTRAWEFDPFAVWSASDAVRSVQAAFDSAQTPEHLMSFNAALDSLLTAMSVAASRLDDLDYRFASHLRTGLEVTLATPDDVRVARLEAHLAGAPVTERALSDAERAALAAGGILEVLRQVVEPRPYELEIRAWTSNAAAPSVTRLQVNPTPDRVVRVHLELHDAGKPARYEQSVVEGGP